MRAILQISPTVPPVRLRIVLAPVQAPHASSALVRRRLLVLLYFAARPAQSVVDFDMANLDCVVHDVYRRKRVFFVVTAFVFLGCEQTHVG